MRSQAEIETLLSGVINDACPPCYSVDSKARRKRIKERELAVMYCARFSDRMQSHAPYRSRDEAIQKLAPVAVWFLGWAARQFAIAIIKLLWERWHEPQAQPSHNGMP